MHRSGALRQTVPGPWGPVHLAATELGLVAVEWLTTEAAFEAKLAGRLRAPVVAASLAASDDVRLAHLRLAADTVSSLLAGEPTDGKIPFDLTDRPPWDQRVLAAVAAVGWGETASYGEIARRVGAPRAARAVGGALGRNPISLIIPCHRVIAADGTLGGYGGNAWGGREEWLAVKRDLLLREGITVRAREG